MEGDFLGPETQRTFQEAFPEYARLRHRVTLTLQNWRGGGQVSADDARAAEEALGETVDGS